MKSWPFGSEKTWLHYLAEQEAGLVWSESGWAEARQYLSTAVTEPFTWDLVLRLGSDLSEMEDQETILGFLGEFSPSQLIDAFDHVAHDCVLSNDLFLLFSE